MTKNADETRLRILTAARNLFSCHGFPGTSLDDILTAAGITKGAFYHHFKTKEHVCEFLLDEAIGAVRCMAEGLDPGLDPRERIRRTAAHCLHPGEEGLRQHCRLVLRLTGDLALFGTPIPDKINRFWEELHAALAAMCRQVPALHPSCRRPEQAASMLLTVLSGALWMQQSPVSGMDAESLMEIGMRMVVAEAQQATLATPPGGSSPP